MIESNLSFGLQKKSSQIFGTGKIGSIYPINSYEKVITTNKEFVKIEDTTIKKSINCQFSTSIFIEEANLVVAVSVQKSELFVFTLNDMNNPIISNFQTNQLGIFHLIYSKRSSVLLTIGFGVKIWNFNVQIPDRRRSTLKPTVNISLRYSFSGDGAHPIVSPEVSNYEASILISPSFDHSEEIIFLPSSKGINGYDMNGKQKVVMYRLPSSNKTAYCYLEQKKEMLVYDNTSGLILCTTSGFVQSRPLVGTTTLIWMDFLDTENALLMDAKGNFYILDLKTGRSFHCYSVLNSITTSSMTQKTIDPTLSMMAVLGQSSSMSGLCEINGGYGGLSTAKKMPSRVFLLRESKEVCLCFGPRLEVFKIDIPWTLWAVNISKTKALRRIEKPGEAARVLAFTSNSFVKIFSPKDGKILTDATPRSLSSPSNFFYDRGFLIYYQGKDDKNGFMVKKVHETQTQERLFVILDDGSISVFDPNQNPCKEIAMAELKANSMTVCYFNNEFCYAISSLRSGEVYLVDKTNFNQIKKKFSISHDIFCNLLFDPISLCLVCIMNRETVLFDLQSQKIVSTLKLKGSSLVCLNNGLLYYGYENGDINFVKIETNAEKSQKELHLLSKEPNRLHFDSVTGFAFSQSFWVSVSADQTVRYWDYSNGNFFTINMPCRLFGCEIINGKRDVVVGTDNELMLIDGKTVFDGEIDEIDPLIDNFDNERDDFQKVLIENVMRMKREEEKKEIEQKLKYERENNNRPLKDDRNKHKYIKLNQNKQEVISNENKNKSNQQLKNAEMTDEMKAQMKEEEEKRRNKAFEAMMNITDHDRKFRQLALAKQKETEEDKEKANWSIKLKSKSKEESTTKNNEINEEKSEIIKNNNDTQIQITAPSVIMKTEDINNNKDNNNSHAPRRKRKRRVQHNNQKEDPTNDTVTNINISENKRNEMNKETDNKIKQNYENGNKQTVSNHEQIKEEFLGKTEKVETSFVNEKLNHKEDSIDLQPIKSTLLNTSTETELKIETENIKNNKNNIKEETINNNIQPPKIETTSIRNKKFNKNTMTKRENIATSPISTINFENEEEDQQSFYQPQTQNTKIEETKSVKSDKVFRKEKLKERYSSSLMIKSNHKNKKSNDRQRNRTPPQVVRHFYCSKRINDKKKRRIHSSQSSRKMNKFFEIPSQQYVLDFEEVRSQFCRGKIELLPLVQRIEISISQSSNQIQKMKEKSLNEQENKFSKSKINNKSEEKEKVKPLIEQKNVKIVTPRNATIKRNQSLCKIQDHFPSCRSTRPLGHYENSVTYINSSNPTPRQLIPKFKKSSSSVDNQTKQNKK